MGAWHPFFDYMPSDCEHRMDFLGGGVYYCQLCGRHYVLVIANEELDARWLEIRG